MLPTLGRVVGVERGGGTLSDANTSRGTFRLREELGSNAALLATLMLLLTVVPFLPGHDTEGIVARIAWTAVILVALVRTSGRRIVLWVAFVIAVPSLLTRWFEIPLLSDAGPLVVALFFLLISAHILADVFRPGRIHLDQILGGINVYLLLGLLFARLHLAIASNTPGAYMLGDLPLETAAAQAGQQFEDGLRYFSFTTLTTLGYGDIRPVAHAARVLSTTEAVIGQLYIAILIAGLVGNYSARAQADSTP